VSLSLVCLSCNNLSVRCSTATESDYLEVTWLANRPSKRFCSSKDSPPPAPLTATSSDGSQLRLTFQSDGVYDATGFLAHYKYSTFVPSTHTCPRNIVISLLGLELFSVVCCWCLLSPFSFNIACFLFYTAGHLM